MEPESKLLKDGFLGILKRTPTGRVKRDTRGLSRRWLTWYQTGPCQDCLPEKNSFEGLGFRDVFLWDGRLRS